MTLTARIATTTCAALGLTVLLACSGGGGGGGSTTNNAAALTYTDPTTGDYRLLRDASSSATHLVLNLVGPASTSLSGVGFYLTTESAKASWATVSGSEFVGNTLFTNYLMESKVTTDQLQAGIYQKNPEVAKTTGASSVLATVALDLKSGVAAGTTIALAATPDKAIILDPPGASPSTTGITITVGSLVAE